MSRKHFYQELGTLLYAIAFSDQRIRRKEKNAMRDFIWNVLLSSENKCDSNGVNLAMYTQCEFEDLEKNKVPAEKAFMEFLSWYKANEEKIGAYDKGLFSLAAIQIAGSFKNINKKEKAYLEILLSTLQTSNKDNPMKTILVPTDFSENAEKALYYALDFAIHNGSKVIILNAWDLPHQRSTFFVTIKNQIQEKAEMDMKELLDKVKENQKYKGLEIESYIMMGDAAPIIKQVAAVKNAGLIIMGTTGAGGIKKIFMGSNTTAVIEDAPCPVLAIPENAAFSQVEKILYATDFKDDKLNALKQLLPIAKFFDAEIMIAHISDHEQSNEAAFKTFTEEVKQNLDYHKISFKYFNNSNVIDGLNQLIKSDNIQLLAMLTKKRGYFEKVFSRSFTKEMANAATAPLLAFQFSPEKLTLVAEK
ncbi:MAG: universal stress protein [Bacteroidetes bacterium]|nr:universal stress protein [Bacteroidota bacterium]